jgi:hypothetical protein
MFAKYVDLIDRPQPPADWIAALKEQGGTLKKNLSLKSPVYGGFRGRFLLGWWREIQAQRSLWRIF